MRIVPAIDIFEGKVVRLKAGNFNTAKIYSANPVQIAKDLSSQGFKRLHLVDLEGAKNGALNKSSVKLIRDILKETSIMIDFSGGIRSVEDASAVFEAGCRYIGIGSITIKEPDVAFSIVQNFKENIFIACDTKEGLLRVSGWQEETSISYMDFLNEWIRNGSSKFMLTDISRDGMLNGVNTELYKDLKKNFPNTFFIASGGVTDVNDLYLLKESKVEEVVVGKALLEGRLDLNSIMEFIW